MGAPWEFNHTGAHRGAPTLVQDRANCNDCAGGYVEPSLLVAEAGLGSGTSLCERLINFPMRFLLKPVIRRPNILNRMKHSGTELAFHSQRDDSPEEWQTVVRGHFFCEVG